MKRLLGILFLAFPLSAFAHGFGHGFRLIITAPPVIVAPQPVYVYRSSPVYTYTPSYAYAPSYSSYYNSQYSTQATDLCDIYRRYRRYDEYYSCEEGRREALRDPARLEAAREYGRKSVQ